MAAAPASLDLLAFVMTRRDPTAYIHLLMLWMAIQLLIWLVGRDSLENEFWRSFALAVMCTIVPAMVFAMGSADGLEGMVAAAILLALPVWIVTGLLYEPETRQRMILSTAIPAISLILMPVSLWLRAQIFGVPFAE